jgi:hypothetical protein
MTETFVRAPVPVGGITPNPNPTNTETITTAVTQAVTVTQPTPGGSYDFHVAETDVLNGGLKTSTDSSDEFYNYATAGTSTDIFLQSYTSTNSDNVVDTATIGTGNGLVDILPEVTGAISPANTAAETTSETDPDGANQTETIAANGAYTESGVTAPTAAGLTTSTTVNADGSGSYTFPFLIAADSSYTVSAPSPQPSGSPDAINVVLTVPDVLVTNDPEPGATPVAIPIGPIPVWYPEPIVLFQQTSTDNGPMTMPSSCNVPAALTKTANQIVQTTTTVDPVFGETDVNTQTTYTEQGIGAACMTLSDVVTGYYDLSGQVQIFSEGDLGFANTPFQTTTTTETLGITSATVLGLTSKARTTQVAAVHGRALVLRAGVAHFHAVLAKHRIARRTEFYRALVARVKGGRR